MFYVNSFWKRTGHCICVFIILQVWRLVTNFMYFGPIGFNFLFNIIFAYRYCRMLEEGSFRNKTADFFFMILFGCTLLSLMTVSFTQFLNISVQLSVTYIYVTWHSGALLQYWSASVVVGHMVSVVCLPWLTTSS